MKKITICHSIYILQVSKLPMSITALKVSKYGVFSGPFGLNTEKQENIYKITA